MELLTITLSIWKIIKSYSLNHSVITDVFVTFLIDFSLHYALGR